jgi:hypothetical protein
VKPFKVTKERRKMKNSKALKIVAPIGAVPSEDKELKERIERLGESPNISDVLSEITSWEESSVREFREHERTTKSGRLQITCW